MDFDDFLTANGRLLRLSGGDHVFRQGDEDRSFYLLREGLLKAYYSSADGKEAVKSFIRPGDFIASLTAVHEGKRCSFSLICLQPSVLLQLDFRSLYAASQQSLEIATRLIDFLLAFAMKKERREMEFLSLSAEDRYRLLLARSPDLVGQLRQKDIARYLGITPVALSRIRARCRE